MKAAVIHEFGDVDVLKYEEVATPEPKPGYVLVKVLAAGVNRLDTNIRDGSITKDIPLPHVLGGDAVGEIAALGEDVHDIEIGQRVIVFPGFVLDQADYDIRPSVNAPSFALPGLGVWGSYAQFLEVPARFVLPDETGLPAEQLASPSL